MVFNKDHLLGMVTHCGGTVLVDSYWGGDRYAWVVWYYTDDGMCDDPWHEAWERVEWPIHVVCPD